METWEEIRAALDALLRLTALGVLAALGLAVRSVLPHLPALFIAGAQALREWLTTMAKARWDARATEAAAAILDPENPAANVAAEASKMLAGIPDAVATLGGTKDAAQAAIERRVSALRVAMDAPR
ncbi:hypothetical protein [Roseomonas sp. USHLN139]|uniref:hypothetical protein n=1 Tax=Roseomonas sp. USHLN139 TaxID=3081298 RepID=UPI003B0295B3